MPRLYDHIDLRVHSLAEGRAFYESLLPALGFTRKTEIPGWLQYEAEAPDGDDQVGDDQQGADNGMNLRHGPRLPAAPERPRRTGGRF